MSAQLTESDVFTPEVIVPEDGDSRNAASVLAAFQSLTNRARFLLNRHNGRLGVHALSVLDFVSAWDLGDPPRQCWELTSFGAYLGTQPSGLKMIGWFPLNRWLVRGCTITAASVRVKPRRANATVGNRIKAVVMKMPALAAPVNAPDGWLLDETGPSAVDNGTNADQLISIAPNVANVDTAAWVYALAVISGGASDSVGDQLYGGSITLA